MKKRLYPVFVFILLMQNVFSQYYSEGADPFSTDWRQIKTENFQIIFPAEYEPKAQEFAVKMDYAYAYVNESMSAPVRKLSVIIHTQTANSNGMVSWVPRRMELWTTPSQGAFNYSQEWMEQLILHETRHFVQENNMNQGITKVLSFILGEQAEMIPMGLMSRIWFLEGDAVSTETALSYAGRGRMPSFEQGLRALTLEKGKQNYEVALLGSYRIDVPNYYEVGFHTVAVNRLFRDSALFADKMDDIGSFHTLRGFRDSREIQYYGFAIDYLQKEWQRQDEELEKTPFKNILSEENLFNTYEFLKSDADKLYALRTTLTKIPQIVEIDSAGSIKVVAEPGWKSEDNFSVRNGKLVYADIIPDVRWDQRSFADIFITDLRSGKNKRLTRKQIYQAPCLNADATKIVAQRVDGNGMYQLHILDAQTGKVIAEIPNPKNQFYFSPQWSDDDSKLVYIAQEKDRKSLKYFDLTTEEEVILVEETYGELLHPVWSGNKVYFTGSYSGINNIYECDINTKAVKRMTSARFGADYAAVCNGQLCYANYTSDGYKPVEYLTSDVAGESLSQVENVSLCLGDKLTKQEGGIVDFSKVNDTTFEVKNYSRLGHLFHFHSWFPMIPVTISSDGGYAYDTKLFSYPFVSILSQNVLSTSFLSATYDGNPANSDERFNIDYTYEGFFPKLSLDVSWGDYDAKFYQSQDDYEISKVKDLTISPSISIPLVFKQGPYYMYFTNQLLGEYARLRNSEFEYSKDYMTYGFYSVFARIKQSATRDLYSPQRQQLGFYYSHSNNSYYDQPYKLAAYGRLYLSGFALNHSILLGINWQKKDINSSNVFGYLPRGYSSSLNSELLNLSADYVFPICYPDIHLGRLINLKRCSMSIYGDRAWIEDANKMQDFLGYGGSFFTDVNFLCYEVDVKLGVRAGVAHYGSEVSYPVNLIFGFSIF